MYALMTTTKTPGYLLVAEVADPEPLPNEALVRVSAASINRGELRLIAMRPDGWRPGQDVAGVVEAPAADSSGPPAGTRVVAWPDQAGWAELVAVPTDLVVALPEQVDAARAATLPVAGVTALRAVRRGGQILGRRCLVTGATGGVGRFAVEIAHQSGALVTAIASGRSSATDLRDLGAKEVFASPSDASGRYALILESVGGASLEAMPQKLDSDGVLVLFGVSSGEAARLSFADFRESQNCRIELLRVYGAGESRSRGEDLAQLVDLVAQGRLHPTIGQEVDFRQVNQALRSVKDRTLSGKAVLRFDRT
jgi:NADPH:quinone reductase-like Zn-dependent oxidoreductase